MVRPAVTDADNNELGITFTSAIGLLTYCQTKFIFIIDSEDQKQPFSDLPIKGRSVNMQQIYRRTPMPKYDPNKIATQLY